jgi:hypothetical protein
MRDGSVVAAVRRRTRALDAQAASTTAPSTVQTIGPRMGRENVGRAADPVHSTGTAPTTSPP